MLRSRTMKGMLDDADVLCTVDSPHVRSNEALSQHSALPHDTCGTFEGWTTNGSCGGDLRREESGGGETAAPVVGGAS